MKIRNNLTIEDINDAYKIYVTTKDLFMRNLTSAEDVLKAGNYYEEIVNKYWMKLLKKR